MSQDKGGLLGGIRRLGARLDSAIFEDPAPAEDGQVHDRGYPFPAPSIPGMPAASEAHSPPRPAPAVDSKVLRRIETELQKDIPAAYQTVTRTLEGLTSVIEDPSKRYQAVLVSLGAQGTSPEAVIEAVQARIQQIDSYASGLAEDLAQTRQEAVGALQEELQKIDGELDANQRAMHELQEANAALSAQREKAAAKLGSQQAEFASREQAATAALTAIKARAQEELQQLSGHLPQKG